MQTNKIDGKMKVKYVANGKRGFNFFVTWTVISFGYAKEYFHYDKYNAQEFVTWYFLFFRLRATQYFKVVKEDLTQPTQTAKRK